MKIGIVLPGRITCGLGELAHRQALELNLNMVDTRSSLLYLQSARIPSTILAVRRGLSSRGRGYDLGSPVSVPQEPVMTHSRTRKGERAQKPWQSTSFQTWTTRTRTRTWTKTRMRTRRRARTSHQARPRRRPRLARQPRCRQTPHLFRALSPQRPPGAARSQKPSSRHPAAAPHPAKASCASPGWHQPPGAPWRRTQARP